MNDPLEVIEWPDDAERLVIHLNQWDKTCLDICERPEAHPGMVDDGETGGWIYAHKEKLSNLGVQVRWNPDRMEFEIVK